MKKQLSFFTAFIMSLIMIVWSNVFMLLINDQADLQQGSICLLFLQIVLVLKYVSGTLLAMPGSVLLKQVIAGFICADIFVGVPIGCSQGTFRFTAEILIAQLALVIVYSLTERRSNVKIGATALWQPNHELSLHGYN
jgi:hypothetical protein